MVNRFPGMTDRLRSRLRALGFWKQGRPDIARFCAELGYRPQYVYAWLKERVPTAENLRRLSRDLDVPMAWLLFGVDAGVASAAPAAVLEATAGEPAAASPGQPAGRGGRVGRRSAGATARRADLRPRETASAQIIDFRRLREVTERLVDLEGDLEAIIHAFPDSYLWLDAGGVVLSHRAGVGFDAGLLPGELVGRRLTELVPPAAAPVLGEALARALETRGVVSAEYALPGLVRERSFEARFVSLTDRLARGARVLAILRDITERKHAEATSRALVEVASELAGTLDPARAQQRILATMLGLLQGRVSAAWELDPVTGALTCVAAAGAEDAERWLGRVLPRHAGLCGAAVAEGRVVWSADVLADPRVALPEASRRAVEADDCRAGIAAPLRARGGLLGALLLADRPGRLFGSEEVALLEAFGDHAALALENARLYAEAERRRREAEILAELARDLSTSLELDTVLERVARGARELCRSDVACVALREPGPDPTLFRYRAGAGYPTERTVRIVPGSGMGGLALETGRAVRTGDYAADGRFGADYLEEIRRDGVVAQIVAPIPVGERLEGLLYVYNRSARPFTDRDETILLRLADHAGLAIANARLYSDTDRRRRTAESLAELARFLSQSLDPGVVARRIVDSVLELLGVQFAALYELEAASGDLVAVAFAGDAAWSSSWIPRLPAGSGVSGLAVRERRPVVTADLLADPHVMLPPELRERVGRAPFRGGLSIPLLREDRVLGALTVADQGSRGYSAEDIRVAQLFAEHAALTLENARLFEENQRRLADLDRR